MFKKFDTSSSISARSLAKSSLQRNIRNDIVGLYPSLEPYLEQIFPKKAPIYIIKCKDNLQILCIENTPLFVNHFEGPWMPTLRVLHKYPMAMKWVQVDKGAIGFVITSANIMCPGLTGKQAEMPILIPAGEPVAVYATGKEHAIAVGILQMSTAEIRAKNEGVAILNVHHLGDGLWKTQSIN